MVDNKTFTSSSGESIVFYVDDLLQKQLCADAALRVFCYEFQRDVEHSLVLTLLKQVDFLSASKLFSQLELTYTHRNEIERLKLVGPRFRAIEEVLNRTRTIENILVHAKYDSLSSEEIVRQVMRDLPKLKFNGRHTHRYEQFDDGRLFLSDY